MAFGRSCGPPNWSPPTGGLGYAILKASAFCETDRMFVGISSSLKIGLGRSGAAPAAPGCFPGPVALMNQRLIVQAFCKWLGPAAGRFFFDSA